jgi:hypothetical protein
MSSKIADINLSLRLTSRQLQVLTDTLELEVQRTIDSEGFCGGSVDELENMEFRCDLLSMLLQLAHQTLQRQGVAND